MARKSRKNIAPAEVVATTITKYNAAAYVRLSSDARRKNTDSLETQQNIIENFVAASPDIRIVEVYTEMKTTRLIQFNYSSLDSILGCISWVHEFGTAPCEADSDFAHP